jgi:hypothetical protein
MTKSTSTNPLIQIDDIIRPMTDAELEAHLAITEQIPVIPK